MDSSCPGGTDEQPDTQRRPPARRNHCSSDFCSVISEQAPFLTYVISVVISMILTRKSKFVGEILQFVTFERDGSNARHYRWRQMVRRSSDSGPPAVLRAGPDDGRTGPEGQYLLVFQQAFRKRSCTCPPRGHTVSPSHTVSLYLALSHRLALSHCLALTPFLHCLYSASTLPLLCLALKRSLFLCVLST